MRRPRRNHTAAFKVKVAFGHAIHQRRLHDDAARSRGGDQHGRPRLLARQRVRGTAVALDQVRRGLPACLRECQRRPSRRQTIPGFLHFLASVVD